MFLIIGSGKAQDGRWFSGSAYSTPAQRAISPRVACLDKCCQSRMTEAMAEDSKDVNTNVDVDVDPDNVESGPEPDVASIERIYRYARIT